ncbi:MULTISPECIES: sulfurtransferase-like selenium metabolism protein YedF [unclassified Dehalobacter]|uniref:sulfurtransferase-like selenium metabolism protein YedF n=1 Tax=unclassified Dehalobacter TaxID=2635733 RepID=UPI000E6CFDC9|nr:MULTISPECIES: sulfurtransferase-like selenium metabolism protein YedF [unclassified Dehalobacter]RJE48197.1 SirA family protein [Dehalobacter sp. MCB1]TCX49675.1 sulfurtransferase-like selenium metabolism protein YedF [Dehalobacter sp. 14DCB1]TCX50202.1 sulfurtransferase-like selenium metabolism protein YedF [Dehalobacter sp. 12DCB1]
MGYVLLVTSKGFGKGEEILGEKLMYSYLYSLSEGDYLPSHILFLHEGVKLVTEDAPVLNILKSLAEKGVNLYACGICLDFYNLKDQVKVGEIGNMYLNMDIMAQAEKVITLG